ncbi:MAG: methyltransferase [Robiginitomaculum sp.]|nr:MAG: methyltransferase [Robiginitomaculum sp.]
MDQRIGFGLAAILFALSGCEKSEPNPQIQIPIPKAAPIPTGPEIGTLEWAVKGEWRSDTDKARNAWRHPLKTLQFCGLAPKQSVLEVWPGGGWYTQILAPWVKENEGQYRAARIDPDISDNAAALNRSFKRKFEDKDLYGSINTTVLSATSGPLVPPDSVDLILTFRNVHSWLAQGMAAKAFNDFYAALKPGGSFCVVEHRLPDAREQDPLASSGYVQRTLVKALAKDAGFIFDGQSDVNANPKDTADHPFGVWTLAPVRRNAAPGEDPDLAFNRQRYDDIGESDRMTLRFSKPLPPKSGE